MSKLFVLLLLLTSCTTEAKKKETFWHEPCLTDHLKLCGNRKFDPHQTKFTQEESDILMCRISALVDCRIKDGK